MSLLRKYGVEDDIEYPILGRGVVDYDGSNVPVAADCLISLDGAAFAETANQPLHKGGGIFKHTLTAAEYQAKKITVKISDVTATKVFEDQAIEIETIGHFKAQHPLIAADPGVQVSATHSGAKTNTLEVLTGLFLGGAIIKVDSIAVTVKDASGTVIVASGVGSGKWDSSVENADGLWKLLLAGHTAIRTVGNYYVAVVLTLDAANHNGWSLIASEN